MIRYPSIDQYRNAIAEIQKLIHQKSARRDDDGNIVEHQQRTWKFPTVRFTGTVKLHGTNAAVVVRGDQVSYQSRNRVITPEDDNMGFAAWASSVGEDYWRYAAKPHGDCIFFGEWCGGNIQSGVALTGLPLRFVIFECFKIDENQERSDPIDPDDIIWSEWNKDIFMVSVFGTWQVDIDVENPQLAQNQLVAITEAVEAECPAGKFFGVSGVGEGVVWTADFNDHRIRFKVKGEKHSSYRVKTLASIEAENPGTLAEFIDNALTESRMQQGLAYLTEHGLPHTVQSTGDFVRWIVGDVEKEETDTMNAAGLDIAKVKKRLGSTAALRYKAMVWQIPDSHAA